MLNTNKIVGIIIGVVILGGVLVPIINSNSTDGEHTLDVVVIAGQSNAAYIIDYMDLTEVNNTYSEPNTNCYYYGYKTDSLVRPPNNAGDMDSNRMRNLNIHSMYENNQWIIGGEEVGIVNTISKHTNDDVLTINVGIPAHNIAYYEPDSEGGIYINAIIDDAISKIPDTYTTVNKVGWMWCQGESDKTTPVDDYVSSFVKVQSIFTENGFNTCFLVQTKPSDSGNATPAQNQIADTVPNVIMSSKAPATFTVANGKLIDGNSLHYSQLGRIIVGKDVGQVANGMLATNIREGQATYTILAIIPVFVAIGLIIYIVPNISNRFGNQ